MSKFFVLPALLAAVIAAPVAAGDGEETVRTVIQTNDLDLTDTAHQRRLERRVRSAIGDICDFRVRDLKATRSALECRRLARAGAEPQVRLAIAQARLSKARLAGHARKPAA